ncbi:MAG: adenylyl-sulfate kinase [Alistipes sp.]|nr:adenylyl-sulfate kinase [Alistipes sp.]
MENIFPDLPGAVDRGAKERLLDQRGMLVWFTGLSGSGKSTLATALERELHSRGYLTILLDGDNIRSGINSNLGFSPEDRLENVRRIAEVAKLFVKCGVIAIAAFISPTEEIRQIPKRIVGPENYREIYVSTPLEVCEERDVKGLYKKARSGQIAEFTGISAPFEEPGAADIRLDTSRSSIDESIDLILTTLGFTVSR